MSSLAVPQDPKCDPESQQPDDSDPEKQQPDYSVLACVASASASSPLQPISICITISS